MANNISTLGQSLGQIARLKTQHTTLADLQMQLSSNKKTQKLSGLGADIVRTVKARSGINSLQTYNDNITNADRRLKLMSTAVTEMTAQTKNIANSFSSAVQQGDFPDFESMKHLANNVYEFILDLVNQQDGDRYLFAGSATDFKPITDAGLYSSFLGEFVPDSSDLTNPPLVASGAIGDWASGLITTDQFIASYKNVNDTVLGFSDPLTSNTAGKMAVRVNDNAEFDYTTLANKTAMREVVMLLGVIKALPPVEYAPGALNDPTATTIAGDTSPNPPREKQDNFFQVIRDLAVSLNKAIDSLEGETYRLSQVRSQISIVKASHTDQIEAFKDVVAEKENADITEISALILQMQTQLEASYQVTSLVSQLTLANYLR
jgi:flagellin-like hook-associated protein FlgL